MEFSKVTKERSGWLNEGKDTTTRHPLTLYAFSPLQRQTTDCSTCELPSVRLYESGVGCRQTRYSHRHSKSVSRFEVVSSMIVKRLFLRLDSRNSFSMNVTIEENCRSSWRNISVKRIFLENTSIGSSPSTWTFKHEWKNSFSHRRRERTIESPLPTGQKTDGRSGLGNFGFPF